MNAVVAQEKEQGTRNAQVGGLNPSGGTISGHQPVFLPYLGTWQKVAAADLFVWFDDVPFERHGYSNRVQIKTAQGVQWLTVPVKLNGHLDKPIREIEIADGNWKRKHLRTIELAYCKALFFSRYFAPLNEVYASRQWRYLSSFNRALFDWVMLELRLNVPIISASEQGFNGTKSDLVLDMAKKLNARKYIFGPLGKNYADIESFTRAGIEVQFQNFQSPVYSQLHGEFVPNLSILDLLMNVGPDSLKIIKGET